MKITDIEIVSNEIKCELSYLWSMRVHHVKYKSLSCDPDVILKSNLAKGLNYDEVNLLKMLSQYNLCVKMSIQDSCTKKVMTIENNIYVSLNEMKFNINIPKLYGIIFSS